MTIGELSSLGVIKFTRKYLKELCIGGFIAQKLNKNHSCSISWTTDQKLWRKETFSMPSVRRDHILNEIVIPDSSVSQRTKYTFVSFILSVFCAEMKEVLLKS